LGRPWSPASAPPCRSDTCPARWIAEAITAYREALTERTRERVPLDWAMTQNNLGNALSTLGERESGTARLEEAVAAYREALKEQPRERVPLNWAMTQYNLGNALSAHTRSRLVLRKDVEERDGHWKKYLAKSKAIMAIPESRKALAKAKTLIDMQRSVAAKFRFLHHHGLAGMSESTFRKRFGGSDAFLKGLSASDLPAVLKMINMESAEIDHALADANKSYARYRVPIPDVKTGIKGLAA
jgi:tetratricopeptide (TPR) repeat protein